MRLVKVRRPSVRGRIERAFPVPACFLLLVVLAMFET